MSLGEAGHVEQRDEGLVADRHRRELQGIRRIDNSVQRAKDRRDNRLTSNYRMTNQWLVEEFRRNLDVD